MGFEEDEKLFVGGEAHPVTFNLTEESYRRFGAMRDENGWKEAEGLQIVFAHGLAYLSNEREFSRWENADPQFKADFVRLAKRASDFDSMYVVMKYRAYVYRQDVKTLEMHESSLEGQVQNAYLLIDRLREQVKELEMEIERLKNGNGGRDV